MLAYQLLGSQDLQQRDVPVPELGADDVKVRVAYNGICGSDLHFYYAAEGWRRPLNIGHEISGVVEEVGSSVADLKTGDQVCVFPIDSCGDCNACRDGFPVQCSVLDRTVSTVGCGSPIGGLGEFCVIPRHLAIPLTADLTLAQGAMVEPLAVSLTAVQRSGVQSGQTAVVLGGGPIGIGAFLALRASGVRAVVVEPSMERRAALVRLGAEMVLDPSTDDVGSMVRSMTDGRGADAVFECAGVEATFNAAIELVKNRGSIVLIGLFEHPVTFNPTRPLLREIRWIGHNGSTPQVFRDVMEHMQAGRFPTDSWVTHVPWSDIIDGGFERLRQGQLLKVLVEAPE